MCSTHVSNCYIHINSWQGAGYLVAMVHCEGSESDEPEQLLWKHLLHVCHLSLHVQGLSTGYSKDVHGNVSTKRERGGGGGGGR